MSWDHRGLGFWDGLVLWGDLGVGLLVLLAASVLVPALGLRDAALAILVGSAIGGLLLAAAGTVGSDTGAPTMVLLRPAMGLRGSFVPTVFNVLQLVGWGAFEIVVMAPGADYFLLARRRYDLEGLYRRGGVYWFARGSRWGGFVAWGVGVAAFHALGQWAPALGSSLPGAAVAFVVHAALSGRRGTGAAPGAAGSTP